MAEPSAECFAGFLQNFLKNHKKRDSKCVHEMTLINSDFDEKKSRDTSVYQLLIAENAASNEA